MSRLTLRLPNSLHRELKEKAHQEGISLNQYIVYALTRQTTSGYMVYAGSKEEMEEREARFKALRESLPKVSDEEIETGRSQRATVET